MQATAGKPLSSCYKMIKLKMIKLKMMKSLKIMNSLAFIFSAFLFCLVCGLWLYSCEKSVPELAELGMNEGIVGTWVQSGKTGDTLLLSRAGELASDHYGFVIEKDGSFLERKNSSGCGTAPISYANYTGSWEIVSDSLLNITVGYWGGIMTYQIRIISLDPDDLVIRYLYSEDREESR